MRTAVVGTAGHIDHGKSALVKALTGTDPDRLKEEQARGITIDLGFAHFAEGDAQIAFVDVPGHERFVRNMLAGAGGIDAVLLVVDAVESVKPQTREHFEICRLLGIERGVIAVTKIDLATPDTVRQTMSDIARLVSGSFLASAAVVPVSARTGDGLPALRRALAALAGFAPRQQRAGISRVPVDRAFTIKGFGPVVTGTLVSGEIVEGQSLLVFPEGRHVRVRGIQRHGSRASSVEAPERVAVNVAGLETRDLRRGQTLATEGTLAVSNRADVRIAQLTGAQPLRHGVRVHVHHGSAEIPARISLAATRRTTADEWLPVAPGSTRVEIPAGGEAFARLRFDKPAVLTRDDRLIIRAGSPPTTVAGAIVLDPEPPGSGVRRPAALSRFVNAAVPGPPLSMLLEEKGDSGLTVRELVRRCGIGATAAEAGLAALEKAGRAVRIGDRLVSASVVADVEQRALAALAGFHGTHPREAGIVRSALRNRLGRRTEDWLVDACVARLAVAGAVRASDRVALTSHRVTASTAEESLARDIEQALRTAGLTPPEISALAAGLGRPASDVEVAVRALVRDRRLIRAGSLYFHEAALSSLGAAIRSLRGDHPPGARVTIDVGTFKTRFGLTRKHAIPLLEWLDRERITRRVGDSRVVL